MTKKLEEFFNLPPAQNEEIEELQEQIQSTEILADAPVYSPLTTGEKVDTALPTVVGLDDHDRDMDAIHAKAINTYNDLISLGSNVPDAHAGKVFEVANQFLTTAMNAKISKTERKLKMVELQLKKMRAEQVDFQLGNGNSKIPGGGEFDRNELLQHIISSKKSENSDK